MLQLSTFDEEPTAVKMVMTIVICGEGQSEVTELNGDYLTMDPLTLFHQSAAEFWRQLYPSLLLHHPSLPSSSS